MSRRMQKSAIVKRRVARLHAVQALFQMEATGSNARKVTEGIVIHGVGRDIEDMELHGFDEELLRALVAGAARHQSEVDELASRLLSHDWPLDRIDPILRALLRAAGAELMLGLTPPRAIIAEFVEVADSFFPSGRQVGLVNAVIDKMARDLQPAAFD